MSKNCHVLCFNKLLKKVKKFKIRNKNNNKLCHFQFSPRCDGTQQAGASRGWWERDVRDAFHRDAGVHDGPPLLPFGQPELHRRDWKLCDSILLIQLAIARFAPSSVVISCLQASRCCGWAVTFFAFAKYWREGNVNYIIKLFRLLKLMKLMLYIC